MCGRRFLGFPLGRSSPVWIWKSCFSGLSSASPPPAPPWKLDAVSSSGAKAGMKSIVSSSVEEGGDEEWRDLFWSRLKIILNPALRQTAGFTAIMWKICPAKHLSAGMKLKRPRLEASACPHIPSPVSLPARPHPLPHLSLHRDPRPLITSVSVNIAN